MLTAIVLTHNEEKNIKKCLKSLSFCDERIVLDDCSSDDTKKIAEALGAKVYENKLNDNFSAQRNYGLEKAKNEWVLFLDADEILEENLQKEIEKVVNENKKNAYFIPRKDFLFGKELKHGDVGRVSFIRLGKKSKGVWKGSIHEVWEFKDGVGRCKSPILHYPHQTITEFLRELNFYSTIRAHELFRKKIRTGTFQIVCFPILKFLYLFLIKLGFLDGMAGIIHAVLMSFYTFLVRGKLFLQQNKI